MNNKSHADRCVADVDEQWVGGVVGVRRLRLRLYLATMHCLSVCPHLQCRPICTLGKYNCTHRRSSALGEYSGANSTNKCVRAIVPHFVRFECVARVASRGLEISTPSVLACRHHCTAAYKRVGSGTLARCSNSSMSPLRAPRRAQSILHPSTRAR